MDEIKNRVKEISKEAIHLRRIIHANPELALKEEKTASLVEAEMCKLGIEYKRVAGTGVVGVLRGPYPGKTIALRADMDALNISENTNCNFKSQIPGMMHACGHDVHTAVLLGVANVLSKFRENLHGNVKFLFQPAEENGPTGGAPLMIRDRALLDPEPDMVLGLHVHPDFTTGEIGVREGVMTSNSDRIFIKVTGKHCHGSTPHEGVDALVTACHIVTAIQTIISRNMDPRLIGALTLGTIQGGKRYDTVADEVVIEGTCRTFNEESRELVPKRIKEIATDISKAFGAHCEVNYLLGYPSVINAKEGVDLIVRAGKESIGKDNVVIADYPVMFAEDFSYYLENKPGAFFMLGVTDPGKQKISLHNPEFLPPEKCLPVGIEVLSKAALIYLGE